MTRSFALFLSVLVLALVPGCPDDTCPGGARCAPTDSGTDTGDTGDLVLDAPFDVPVLPDVPPAPDAPTTGDAPTDAPLTADNEIISPDCGPADGFALRLGLYQSATMECAGDPLEPSLQFYIHDLGGATLPPTAGATITSTTASSNGNATECPGGSPPCRISDNWSITFTGYTDDVGATGSYTITWGDGSSSTGTFDAAWCSLGPIRCG